MKHLLLRMKHATPPWIRRLRLRQTGLWANVLSRSGRYFAPLFANLLECREPALVDVSDAEEGRPDPAKHNVALVAEALGLSELEAEIVYFIQIYQYDIDFLRTVSAASDAKLHGRATVVACALDRDEAEVRHALSPDGVLYRVGVIHPCGDVNGFGDGYLNGLALSWHLNEPATNLLDLMEKVMRPAQATDNDFSARVTRVAERLAPRFSSFEPGSHALLLGNRLLAMEVGHALSACLKAQLLECDSLSHPGYWPAFHANRYRLAQTMFGGRGRYLLHMLSGPCLLHPVSEHHPLPGITDPPWQHLFLAQARIPTLWIVPDLKDVDPEVLRFFTEIVEV